ncbi:unnamed protein product, partial [Urochloa humidicola]
MRSVVKDQPSQRLRQVEMHRPLFEEDRPLGSRGFEKQKKVCPPDGDQRLLEVHDDMVTREEKEKKDQKFAEIDSPGTTKNPDATPVREKVKAKEEKLGDVDNWCTIEVPNDVTKREKE